MKTQAILKIFGTGQITIPKEWRDFFHSNTLKAVFNKENSKIDIKPIKLVELEETKWISLKQLKKDLDKADLSEQFKKDLLDGYKKSDFYSSNKK